MNANQILTIFVISLLITLSSCNALKKQIDPNREKIGKEGEDYTLSYYKLKEGYCGMLKINVTELGKPLSKKDFMIITINGVGNSERGVEPLFYLDAGKKYNLHIIGAFAAKSLYINNIKVKERDSIVLDVHLKDILWVE